MTKSMVTPEFEAALKRIEAQRRPLAPPAPPLKTLRRSVLQSSGLPESSATALTLLGATHLLRHKK
jgi:hypothetical protein